MTIATAKQYEAEGHFQKGSMGPKIRAAVHFLKHGGGKAVITNIQNVTKAMKSQGGTTIFPAIMPKA